MTGQPIAWPALLAAAWPLWLALLVVLLAGNLERVCAGVAWTVTRVDQVVRCTCGAWRLRGRACSTSRRCP